MCAVNNKGPFCEVKKEIKCHFGMHDILRPVIKVNMYRRGIEWSILLPACKRSKWLNCYKQPYPKTSTLYFAYSVDVAINNQTKQTWISVISQPYWRNVITGCLFVCLFVFCLFVYGHSFYSSKCDCSCVLNCMHTFSCTHAYICTYAYIRAHCLRYVFKLVPFRIRSSKYQRVFIYFTRVFRSVHVHLWSVVRWGAPEQKISCNPGRLTQRSGRQFPSTRRFTESTYSSRMDLIPHDAGCFTVKCTQNIVEQK